MNTKNVETITMIEKVFLKVSTKKAKKWESDGWKMRKRFLLKLYITMLISLSLIQTSEENEDFL